MEEGKNGNPEIDTQHDVRRGRKRYFNRIFIFGLAIALLPLSVTTAAFYVSTQRFLKEQLEEASTHYLDEVIFLTEIVMDRVEEIGRLLFYYPEYTTFVESQGNLTFANLQAPYAGEDLPTLYKYFTNYGSFVRSLAAVCISNELIDSIYMVDRKTDIVYTSNYGAIKVSRFSDNYLIRLISTGGMTSRLTQARDVLLPDGNTRRYITYVMRGSPEGNVFAVNIDALAFHRLITSRMGSRSELVTLVALGPNGEVVLSDRDSNVLIEKARFAFVPAESKENMVTLRIDGRKVLFARQHSPALDWTFISVFRMGTYYSRILDVQIRTALACLTLILALLGIAFLSARRLYRPVQSLLSTIPPGLGSRTDYGKIDELTVLRTAVSEILSEDRKIKDRLRDSLPVLRENFLGSLLEGSTLAAEKILNRMDYLEIPCGIGNLLPVTLGHESIREAAGMEEMQMAVVRTIGTVEQLLLSRYPGVILSTNTDRYCILFTCSPDDLNDIFSRVATLIERLHENTGLLFAAGIGSHCLSVFELPDSYRKATEALQYGLAYKSFDVHSWEEIPATGEVVSLRALAAEPVNELLLFLRAGDQERADESLHRIVEIIQSSKARVGAAKLRQFFIRIGADILDLIDEMGIDQKDMLVEYCPFFDEVSKVEALEDYRELFCSLIRRISYCIQETIGEKKSRHIKEMMKILEEDHGETINLSTVAARLSLNPSYVSRLFRAECGMTFTRYLTDLRINEAMNLLSSTTLTIKEISRRVGYWNVTYFTSLFREKTGATPGEYMRRHRTTNVKT